ncbi:ArsR/SmtB family transcription factor [Leekyejoonella antrihumi]|uniref:Winged helix-turn-helix transcriptional regulator n=1 Tax=Leekyejoonella antrihumi TaxID=1660198 RepID=A0A563DWR3_9MICO|nr:winged helix-turn-helix domain-containing protein [Leekyejoonella antrihumi]TWP34666.1 winged helix-turn-helix transcriptional regulator [Leekyejoonella antrihumi]
MEHPVRQVDLAAAGALFADPARVAMLTALADGRALPAGELAAIAGVSAATATAHLRRLVDGGLVRVTSQGRHRYHELSGPQVAVVLESLARIAPSTPIRSLRQSREAHVLAEARTCYDHLAGARGVELRERLLTAGVLKQVDDLDHRLTERGDRVLAELDIDVDLLRATRRVFARSCLDWTQRRPHLAGALPAAMTQAFLDRGWLARTSRRGLRVASHYQHELDLLLRP